MNRKDYQQVKQIFQSVLEVTANERADYLDKACDGDDVLRGEVERLLDSFDSGYLEKPAIGKVAGLIVGNGLEVGQEIGHYKIVKKIGAGGMGEVYLAEDIKLDRRVALKILPQEFAEDKNRMSRFVREAKSASSLNHPNIITIHEIGEADGKHFIATEYIEGETLRDGLNREKLSVKSTLEISIQIASALQAAHAAGIIHRDIKPENAMIRPDGLVKILDFGIAKLSEPPAHTGGLSIDEEAATAIQTGTTPGMIIGTANYMSPEQARGQLVDARSDIFSFGVVLYEMLTGKKAFAGETAMDAIGAILHKEPAPMSETETPKELRRIVEKCLRKDREERCQTVKDLRIDLKDIRQELEFQNKLERAAAPNREEVKTQILEAPATAN
ncbi:MAG: serine/threonine protein kinase, partial [Acidobacteriota bacterium]|nr:serine/threonine protein kinase [Acidobacteriota bacterium]